MQVLHRAHPGATLVTAASSAVASPSWTRRCACVTIAELGILRDVAESTTGAVTVTITPTYSGCPAMDVIRADIRRALRAAGYPDVEVRHRPRRRPGRTDWITDGGPGQAGRAPGSPRRPGRTGGAVPLRLSVRCPRCGSPDTEELSRFGSTACKALWRCRVLPRALRPGEGAVTGPRAGCRRPDFHPLPVAAVDRLTDDAVAVTFAVPAGAAGRRSRSRPAST